VAVPPPPDHLMLDNRRYVNLTQNKSRAGLPRPSGASSHFSPAFRAPWGHVNGPLWPVSGDFFEPTREAPPGLWTAGWGSPQVARIAVEMLINEKSAKCAVSVLEALALPLATP